jgi:hypothetical protein
LKALNKGKDKRTTMLQRKPVQRKTYNINSRHPGTASPLKNNASIQKSKTKNNPAIEFLPDSFNLAERNQ